MVRVLALILLLAFPQSVSKVVCISPSGHDEIEDWASACCAPSADAPGAAFSEPALCQGCTDYPVVPGAEIKRSHSHSVRATHHHAPVLFAIASAAEAETIAVACGPAPPPMPDPVTPALVASLRC